MNMVLRNRCEFAINLSRIVIKRIKGNKLSLSEYGRATRADTKL